MRSLSTLFKVISIISVHEINSWSRMWTQKQRELRKIKIIVFRKMRSGRFTFRHDKKLVIRHDNPPPPHIFKLNIYISVTYFFAIYVCARLIKNCVLFAFTLLLPLYAFPSFILNSSPTLREITYSAKQAFAFKIRDYIEHQHVLLTS